MFQPRDCSPRTLDDVIEFVLPYVADPRDKGHCSLVSKQWHRYDSLLRQHVTVKFCYATKPERLRCRFPSLHSLKIKGRPRAHMFHLLNIKWGGFVKPWIRTILSYRNLKSLHLRRMIVTDEDLEEIATLGSSLESLKLEWCDGFSTDGLYTITSRCRKMSTLSLESSFISETSGEWFQELSLYNSVLQTLNIKNSDLLKDLVPDLEVLASRCSLRSVKISNNCYDIGTLGQFFLSANKLEEYSGGSFDRYQTNFPDIRLPASLTSLGLVHFRHTHLPSISHIARSLVSLDLLRSPLSQEGYCQVLSQCQNLQVLKTLINIGDQGLETVANNCKGLRRLRIERDANQADLPLVIGPPVTERGLIAISEQCLRLEYLAVYVASVTNEALSSIGANMTNLTDFRLVCKTAPLSYLPLDKGVADLLEGCQKMTRFGLKLSQGGLTDVGLKHIGRLSRNVTWMLLGNVGDSDKGLRDLSKGCPRLEKLEIKGCCFTGRALASATNNLLSLRYMWVKKFKASYQSLQELGEMNRPNFHGEYFGGDRSGDLAPSNFFGYYSIDGPRTDRPQLVASVREANSRSSSSRTSGLRRTAW